MVCLPFSSITKMRASATNSAGDSLVPVDASSSTIMGIMTSGQPSRTRLNVPSKSNTANLGAASSFTSRTISIEVPGRNRVGPTSATRRR